MFNKRKFMNTLDIIVLIILILSALGFILWLFTGGSKPYTKWVRSYKRVI